MLDLVERLVVIDDGRIVMDGPKQQVMKACRRVAIVKSEDYKPNPDSHSDNDLAYMQSLSAAVVQRSPMYLVMVVVFITLFFFAALIWMSWAEIDVVVRGNGKVIPARQVQLIQSLEGGIISELLVHEGDLVEANQSLIKISDVAFSSSYEENRLTYFELRAKSARLKAEAFGMNLCVMRSLIRHFLKC